MYVKLTFEQDLQQDHSIGTVFCFLRASSLYEYYKSASPSSLVAEKGRSFDFGVQKDFVNKGLNIDLTFFNHKYEDTIEGWKTAGGTPVNMAGVVRTRGLELLSNFKPKKNLNFDLAYTYNSTYDGADFDDPDLGPGSAGDFLNSQMVRVPRHLCNILMVLVPLCGLFSNTPPVL